MTGFSFTEMMTNFTATVQSALMDIRGEVAAVRSIVEAALIAQFNGAGGRTEESATPPSALAAGNAAIHASLDGLTRAVVSLQLSSQQDFRSLEAQVLQSSRELADMRSVVDRQTTLIHEMAAAGKNITATSSETTGLRIRLDNA